MSNNINNGCRRVQESQNDCQRKVHTNKETYRSGNSSSSSKAAVAARQTTEERYNDLKTVWRDLQRCHEEYLMKLDSEEEVEEA